MNPDGYPTWYKFNLFNDGVQLFAGVFGDQLARFVNDPSDVADMLGWLVIRPATLLRRSGLVLQLKQFLRVITKNFLKINIGIFVYIIIFFWKIQKLIQWTYSVCFPGRTSSQPAETPVSDTFSAFSMSKMNKLDYFQTIA